MYWAKVDRLTRMSDKLRDSLTSPEDAEFVAEILVVVINGVRMMITRQIEEKRDAKRIISDDNEVTISIVEGKQIGGKKERMKNNTEEKIKGDLFKRENNGRKAKHFVVVTRRC